MNPYLPNNSNYLYYMVEASRMQLSPMRYALHTAQHYWESTYNPMHYTNLGRTMRAVLEIADRLTRKYEKPEFGINEITFEDKIYGVKQQTVLKKSFCNLDHFGKVNFKKSQPKLLIVAPMAGHHATLLRSTVHDLLPFFDIYITDWIDASQVPLADGRFDMDDFIEYIMEFIKFLGPDIHVMAVCQPTVPVLAATALLAEEKQKYIPRSMILIGGPVDASKNPTKVNTFATGKTLEWFERMLITIVPPNYPGYNRQVYPGFLQLAGFMSLNVQRHISAHVQLFKDLLVEDDVKAERQKKFYDDYLSVMDMPAEFYLQTIKEVFQDFALAKGTLMYRKRKVDLKFITHCSLLGIEGENDDIAGVGQTKEALHMCTSIPLAQKKYYLQKGVGHYGVFSGSKFRQFIVPVIKDFVYSCSN